MATVADFDMLVGLLPVLSRLGPRERGALVAQSRVGDAPAGSSVIRHGELGDTAYFILSGRLVAGTAAEDGGYRSLSAMGPGDFFGEIAALTGSPRTANVVADEPATLMEVPATVLRSLMTVPQVGQLILSKLTERLARTTASDLPKLAGLDQATLRDLRTRQPAGEPKSGPAEMPA
jgi:CRP/FNR family cyclic AMP-dependent transcriptional regulator